MAGETDKVKGAVKETAGKVTGNERVEAEGKTDKAKGEAKNAAHDVKETAKGAADSLKKGWAPLRSGRAIGRSGVCLRHPEATGYGHGTCNRHPRSVTTRSQCAQHYWKPWDAPDFLPEPPGANPPVGASVPTTER
jgi:uncharacterized protein YjbJ (UPF0337 family)